MSYSSPKDWPIWDWYVFDNIIGMNEVHYINYDGTNYVVFYNNDKNKYWNWHKSYFDNRSDKRWEAYSDNGRIGFFYDNKIDALNACIRTAGISQYSCHLRWIYMNIDNPEYVKTHIEALNCLTENEKYFNLVI